LILVLQIGDMLEALASSSPALRAFVSQHIIAEGHELEIEALFGRDLLHDCQDLTFRGRSMIPTLR